MHYPSLPALPRLMVVGLLAACATLAACAETTEPDAPGSIYDEGEEVRVVEPVDFTDEPYTFTGPTSIADLRALVTTNDRVWYGFGPDDGYPQGDVQVLDEVCTVDGFPNQVAEVAELPTHIEGVTTLHPRFYFKAGVCGQDERYYGAFMLEDASGGILVLKDSRIADFTFGDRVRLRVRGLIRFFDVTAVLVYDEQEVVGDQPIAYEVTDQAFTGDDVGHVRRITGVVTSEATNTNFNEMVLTHPDDANITWKVSLDREFGQRNLGIEAGDTLQLTGPVLTSFGEHKLLVARLGQVEWVDAQ